MDYSEHGCKSGCQEGGTLVFSYIRRLGPSLEVQNFEFQLGVFKIMNIFGGIKILWIFFWGHHKIGLDLRVNFMHFRVKV